MKFPKQGERISCDVITLHKLRTRFVCPPIFVCRRLFPGGGGLGGAHRLAFILTAWQLFSLHCRASVSCCATLLVRLIPCCSRTVYLGTSAILSLGIFLLVDILVTASIVLFSTQL